MCSCEPLFVFSRTLRSVRCYIPIVTNILPMAHIPLKVFLCYSCPSVHYHCSAVALLLNSSYISNAFCSIFNISGYVLAAECFGACNWYKTKSDMLPSKTASYYHRRWQFTIVFCFPQQLI